jgi:glutathione synthase/RimK-type ligase-like ATP-grasp enzyme
MKKILSAKVSMDSAMMIRDHIENLTGVHYLVTHNPSMIDDGVLFNYGMSCTSKEMQVCSTCDFVKGTVDKLWMSNYLTKRGYYTPQFLGMAREPEKFPVIVRETLRGTRGEGIHIVKDIEEYSKLYDPSYYWTPYIKSNFELRVGVWDTKILFIYKKVDPDGVNEENLPIRGMNDFKLKDINLYPKVEKLIDGLAPMLKSIGGMFYGLDIAWDRVRQQYVIFEVNSGPWLGSKTSLMVANKLVDFLDLERI